MGLSSRLVAKLAFRYIFILVISCLSIYVISYEVLKNMHLDEITEYGEYVSLHENGFLKRSTQMVEDFSISFSDDIQAADTIVDELFTLFPDGTYRKNPDTHNSILEAGVYIDDSVELTDQLKKRISFIYNRINNFGIVLRSQITNLYFLGRENYVIVFWPEVDWYQEVKPDYEISEQIYYQVAEPRNNPYRKAQWTSWYLDIESGKYVVSVVFPLFVNGRFIGSVGSDILLEYIGNPLPGGSLLDSKFLIVSPEQGVLNPQDLPKHVIKDVTSVGQGKAVAKNGYFFYSTTIPGPDWQLVVVTDGFDIMMLAFQIALIALAFELLGFAMLALLLFLVIRRMVLVPLTDLSFSFELIAAGKKPSARHFDEETEVSRLFNSFNKMADAIILQSDEVKTRRQHLQEIIDSSIFVAIIETDVNGVITLFNSGAERLLGYKSAELIGTHTPETFHLSEEVKERAEELSAYYGRPISGFDVFVEKTRLGEYEERQWTYVHKNGNHIPVNLVVTAVHNEYGDINGFLGIAVDITRLKSVEEELRNSHTTLQSILDSMPMAVIGMDEYAGIAMWSKGAESMLGIAAKDAIRRRISDLVSLSREVVDSIDASIGERFILPRVYLKDQDIYLRISGIPVADAGFIKSVVTFDNISSAVQMEKIIIQNEKIMSVGGIAAGVAHEINNPLSVIMQSIGTLERRLLGGNNKNRSTAEKIGLQLEAMQLYMHHRDIGSLISLIKNSGERAAEIVENMLQFARKSSQQAVPVKIDSLIDETIKLAASDYSLKKNYDFKKIRIEKKYAGDIPEIECHDVEIQQVILNLLTNAAQSLSGQSEQLIRIELEHRDEFLFIGVRDNGPGIPAEVMDMIFQPFFTTKGKGVGTGLGLSVSKMIIEQNHHGSLEVENYGGAYFKILIPIQYKEDV